MKTRNGYVRILDRERGKEGGRKGDSELKLLNTHTHTYTHIIFTSLIGGCSIQTPVRVIVTGEPPSI